MRPSTAPAVLLIVSILAVTDIRATQDPAALAREGTAAIETHRFGDALDAFTRAAALQPDDASLCFGAGLAAFMLGQNDIAQDRFECALAIKPNYVAAAQWLGDLHYRAGRLDEAIATYQSARGASREARVMGERLASWRKEQALQSRFHELRSDHFTAFFEQHSHEPRVRVIVDRLEAAYSRLGATLGVYPRERVTVVLYSREQFRDITSLPGWSVAAYDGQIRVPLDAALEQGDEIDRVLSHELVHVLVARLAGRTVPAWLNEGLATVLEPGGAQDSAASLAGTTGLPALSELHRSFVDLPRRDAEIAYALAARAVRLLIDRHGAAAVVALLEDLGRGAPFARAFERHFKASYEEFGASRALTHTRGRSLH